MGFLLAKLKTKLNSTLFIIGQNIVKFKNAIIIILNPTNVCWSNFFGNFNNMYTI